MHTTSEPSVLEFLCFSFVRSKVLEVGDPGEDRSSDINSFDCMQTFGRQLKPGTCPKATV